MRDLHRRYPSPAQALHLARALGNYCKTDSAEEDAIIAELEALLQAHPTPDLAAQLAVNLLLFFVRRGTPAERAAPLARVTELAARFEHPTIAGLRDRMAAILASSHPGAGA
ncbi:hypothetical protein [Buchananella hordeovulneris]|uniref:hypothetical protein n=1 Tax=Buchananella hordeovulneris TaxID=52770 RepID=UPI000F604500|nr:hypothetical protein [Buchananella hordeovulneris]RRD45481.1 hypothetical protein EII13_01045 [Buchananella hordeovulneris]